MTLQPNAAQATRARLFQMLTDPAEFASACLRAPLRPYQLPPARAVLDSVLNRRGLTFAVMMSRQAGKNQTAAVLEAQLLTLFRRAGGFIVKAQPTYRPQAINSLLRIKSLLARSALPAPTTELGYMLATGNARLALYSASDKSSVVGATANILLECDEAQDVDEDKWNRDFRPMAASTNATTVLWGTAWTSATLLARTIRALEQQQQRDGIRRVFKVPWDQVAEHLPAYGQYVTAETERLGRLHPMIRTQYYLEEIDEQAGMFPPLTQALMRGTHPRQEGPTEGRAYALLIDIAGAQEDPDPSALARPDARRDSTVCTVVELSRADAVRFLVCNRYIWTDVPHASLYGAILQLADHWQAQWTVLDATGLGAGLASFLRRPLAGRLIPFTFTAASKSELGWSFLGLCNTGRFLDHADDGAADRATFWRQLTAAQYEVLPGPGKLMRWGVPDPTLHDDLLMSAALCAALEVEPSPAESAIVDATDPLAPRSN